MQVSLAVMLLVAAGLLLRSFQALGRVQPGFEATHVLTLRISAGWGETTDMGKLKGRIEKMLNAIRSMPGVEAAATTSTVPGNSASYPAEFKVTERNRSEKMLADMRIVSAGYFAALQVPLLAGEVCRPDWPSDTMVVNRSFAEKFFPGSRLIGYHLQQVADSNRLKPATIRGIVGDVREEGRETPAQPTVYWCFSAPIPDPYYLVRTHGDPQQMADTLRQKIRALEPARSVFAMMPLEEHLGERQSESRMRTAVLTLFAVTAISLVSLGLFGTISYLGRTRRREIGLRLAVGALPRQIVGSFLGQGIRVVALAGAVGLGLSAVAAHALAGVMYGVSPLDPVTYACVLGIAMMVSLASSLIPSILAARVDPTEMLREE